MGNTEHNFLEPKKTTKKKMAKKTATATETRTKRKYTKRALNTVNIVLPKDPRAAFELGWLTAKATTA